MFSTRGEQAIPNFAELQSGLPSARHMAPIPPRNSQGEADTALPEEIARADNQAVLK
jgi:hypothetical protein